MPKEVESDMNILQQSAFDIDLNLEPAWCAWFSGLVAGEGSFGSYIDRRHRGVSVHLIINLRDDDSEILYEIKETLKCGTIRSCRASKRDGATRHDGLGWQCRDIGQCRFVLVPLFDKFPLRAKKQRDYEIWRKLTIAISDGQHVNGNHAYVLDLCQQLHDIKKYISPNLVDA